VSNNWVHSVNGDPGFADINISDKTSTTAPTLYLTSGSGAKDNGTYLTQTNETGQSAGTNDTISVDDALYFQDGTWGSSLSSIDADWICVGATVAAADCVQISSIDYGNNDITLVSPITWADGENVWLYKDSSGNRVLYGDAPDHGAHEFSNKTATLTGGDKTLAIGGGGGSMTIGE
jgi:hypothetical protein